VNPASCEHDEVLLPKSDHSKSGDSETSSAAGRAARVLCLGNIFVADQDSRKLLHETNLIYTTDWTRLTIYATKTADRLVERSTISEKVGRSSGSSALHCFNKSKSSGFRFSGYSTRNPWVTRVAAPTASRSGYGSLRVMISLMVMAYAHTLMSHDKSKQSVSWGWRGNDTNIATTYSDFSE
jgi:hypothetical protein